MKILRGGGTPNIFRHPKGGKGALKKLLGLEWVLQKCVYFKTTKGGGGGGGGAPKKLNQ